MSLKMRREWLRDSSKSIPYSTQRRYKQNNTNEECEKKIINSNVRRELFLSSVSSDICVQNFEQFSSQNNGEIVDSISNTSIVQYENEPNKSSELDFINLSLLSIFVFNQTTKSCFNSYLRLFKNNTENETPSNLNSLIAYFKNKTELDINFSRFYYCPECINYFAHNSKKLLFKCNLCGNSLASFFHFNIVNQLKSIIKNSESSIDLRLNKNNKVCQLISSEYSNFITLTINTDGMSIYKSSNVTLWPVYLTLNQIKSSKRFKLNNVILAGVWIGRKKPKFEIFLNPIIGELKVLEKGLILKGEILRVFVTSGVFDKPARAAILNTIQFNGKYGCIKCYQPGESIKSKKNGTIRIYPYQNYQYDKPLRTHSKYLNDLKKAVDSKTIFRGIKGPSPLNLLSFYYPIESTVIDFMHSVLEGVVKNYSNTGFHLNIRRSHFRLEVN